VRHHAAMALVPAPAHDPLAVLIAFRAAIYAAFGARRDALFEVLDALLTSEPGGSPVHLSLAPLHRRGWGSFYAALAEGEIVADTMEGVLAAYAPPVGASEPALCAVDTSVWARCDAETSPERGFYHHPSSSAAPLHRATDRRRLVVSMGGPGAPHRRQLDGAAERPACASWHEYE
jgi:hypothetical protein